MKIFLGIIGMGIGFIISWKYEWLLHNVGRIPTIEKYMGSFGGSRLFYQMLGVIMILLSAMYMTGLLESSIEAILSRFFGAAN